MRAILEFSLPEEQEEHRHALNGIRYSCVLDDFDNYLRSRLKYEHELPDDARAALEAAREKLWELRGDE